MSCQEHDGSLHVPMLMQGFAHMSDEHPTLSPTACIIEDYLEM